MQKIRANIKLFHHCFCVLELRKLKINSFYSFLKNNFGNRVRVLGIDTDSFIFQFFVDDIKQASTENPRILEQHDFGSVPPNYLSGLGDPDYPNASVFGKF